MPHVAPSVANLLPLRSPIQLTWPAIAGEHSNRDSMIEPAKGGGNDPILRTG